MSLLAPYCIHLLTLWCLQPQHTIEHMAWAGGAVLGRVLHSAGIWITKAEYDDIGPQVRLPLCGHDTCLHACALLQGQQR